MTGKENQESLRLLLEELSTVLGGIVTAAEKKSCERCGYMSIRRECTAAFSCINQVFRAGRERPLCSGHHKINFSPKDPAGPDQIGSPNTC